MPVISKNTDSLSNKLNKQQYAIERFKWLHNKVSESFLQLNIGLIIEFIRTFDENLLNNVKYNERGFEIASLEGDSWSNVRGLQRNIDEYCQVEQYKFVDTSKPTYSLDDNLYIAKGLEYLFPQGDFAALKANIAEQGLKNPIRFWRYQGQKIIVDGINCYRACLELGIVYQEAEEHFDSIEEAILWRIRFNQDRRQLSIPAQNYLIGAQYCLLVKTKNHKDFAAGKILAEQYSCTDATIRNYGRFYKAVEHICDRLGDETLTFEFKQKLFSGDIKYSLSSIEGIQDVQPDDLRTAVGIGLSLGRLPTLPPYQYGDELKIIPVKGNRDLDKYVGKVGKYCGIGSAGSLKIEVESEIIFTDPSGVEKISQVSPKPAEVKYEAKSDNKPVDIDSLGMTNQKLDRTLEQLENLAAKEEFTPEHIERLENILWLAKNSLAN